MNVKEIREANPIRHKINDVIFLVADYLNITDCLSLRTVNKTFNSTLQKKQRGPFVSKASFVMATTGLFRHKTDFNSAWVVYYKTAQSQDDGPAILYKLRDLVKLQLNLSFDQFGGFKALQTSGRCFTPDNHTWNVNVCWMLAQVHVDRPFIILSAISDDHIYRPRKNGFNSNYSAFAKEIASAYKAGYRPSLMNLFIRANGEEIFETVLYPPKNKLDYILIDEINPNNQEIATTINELQLCEKNYRKTLSTIGTLVNLFREIQNNNECLLEKSENILQKAEELLTDIFSHKINHQILIKKIVEGFNDAALTAKISAIPYYSLKFFNNDTYSKNIKSLIINFFSSTLNNHLTKTSSLQRKQL